MKKAIVLILLWCGMGHAKAQTPSDMQKQMKEAQEKLKQLQSDPRIREAMQKAQQTMQQLKSNPHVQSEIAQSQHLLDSMKKTNPAMANMQIPDISNMQLPNLDSLSASLNKASSEIQHMNNAVDQSLPKQNPLNHAEQLPKLSKNDLIALVGIILAKIKPDITKNMLLQDMLDRMTKDTSINIAATGAFLLASGGSPDAAGFLICKGILKDPEDPWAVNDLGVFLRDFQKYDQSLQCYFYADGLISGKSKVINTNIGWASGYYGDFNTAIKYFDKALAIDGNYSEALEGEALIAFQQGNIQKLYQCLTKEVKFIGGVGSSDNDGPSDNFATMCATQYAMNEGNTDDQSSDPNNDHTFDNASPDNAGSPNPPPGADVDEVSFPELKKVFIGDPKQIEDALVQYFSWEKKEADVFKQKVNALNSEFKSLKPLVQPPSMSNGVAILYPVSFRKYVELLDEVNISLEKREGWYTSKFDKKLEALRKDVINHDMDMIKQYDNETLNCGKLSGSAEDACMREVNCKWIPQMYKSKNSDLDAIAKLWDDYYNHLVDVLNWYIDASAPLISRVHDEGWNRYLNDERKYKVWSELLSVYARWGEALDNIHSTVDILIRQPVPACASTEVAGVNPPDPYSNPPKHIKEFEGPCFDIKTGFGIGLSAEQTCHGTTISFGAGPFSGFYTHTDDPIYAQNHGYTNEIGTTVSASKDIDIVKLEGKEGAEQSIVSAGVGVEGSVDLKFDNNWNFTSGSSSISASANAAGINIGGISATRTVEMVSGQLNVNPLSVTTTAPMQ